MTSESEPKIEPFTIEVSAAELPESIISRFPVRPEAEARFAVTVAPAQSETEKLAILQRELQIGLDDSAAGRVSEGADVFARLKALFPIA